MLKKRSSARRWKAASFSTSRMNSAGRSYSDLAAGPVRREDRRLLSLLILFLLTTITTIIIIIIITVIIIIIIS